MLPTSTKPKTANIPTGTHPAILTSANLHVATEYQNPARYQAIELRWVVDEMPDAFAERFVRVTLHERGTLANRISALLGRPLTPDDRIDWVLASNAIKDAEVDVYDRNTLVIERTDRTGVSGALDDLRVNGESLIGQACLLTITTNADGWPRCVANGAVPMPTTSRWRAERAPQPAPSAPARVVSDEERRIFDDESTPLPF